MKATAIAPRYAVVKGRRQPGAAGSGLIGFT